MPEQVRLHHVGYVVASIRDVVGKFVSTLAAEWDQQIFDDPLQQVRVCFLSVGTPGNPLIELVEPATGNSPVSRFLAQGGGLHHLCYETDDLAEQLKLMRSRGAMIARPPMPAVAFQGRSIAWVLTKEKLLLEYLESSATAERG